MPPATKNALGTGFVIFALVLAFRAAANAAPSVPAQAMTRAALYQADARQVFTDYHWVIGSERPGRFVAVHAAYPGGANFSGLAAYGPQGGRDAPSTVFYLTVTFEPVGPTDTRCTAGLVSYFRFKDTSTGKQRLLGPAPANSADLTKYVQDLLAQAKKRLSHDHPEFAPP